MPQHDPIGATYETREQWLNAFVTASRTQFDRIGFPLPDKVRVSVGFTSTGARDGQVDRRSAGQRRLDAMS